MKFLFVFPVLSVLALYPSSAAAEPTLAEMLGWRAAVPLIASEVRPESFAPEKLNAGSSSSREDDKLLYTPRKPEEPVFSKAIEETRAALTPETLPEAARPSPFNGFSVVSRPETEEKSANGIKIY